MKKTLKKWMNSFAALFTALVLILVTGTGTVFAEQTGPDVYSEGYCAMNQDTGEVIFSKNMNERYYPASITKVLTALVTLDHCSDLGDMLTFSDTAVNSLSASSSTMTPKGKVGEQMTVLDTLYGLLLCSGNECANALAEYTAGSIDAFVEMMNKKAVELGAVNSHFMNPHGLHDENHYTTPYDIALIFRAALENDDFKWIDSRVNYTIPATNMTEARECRMSHQIVNGTLECEGVYAGKTGHTPEAGRTLLTAASRAINGKNVRVITSVMKSDNDYYYSDTRVLMEYAYGVLSGNYESASLTECSKQVWANGNVRIRQYPSIYSAEKGQMKKGQEGTCTGTIAGWSRIQFGDASYYVSTQYLSEEPVDPNAETTAAPVETTQTETVQQISESSAQESVTSVPASESASQTMAASTAAGTASQTQSVSDVQNSQAPASSTQGSIWGTWVGYLLIGLGVAIVLVLGLIAWIVYSGKKK